MGEPGVSMLAFVAPFLEAAHALGFVHPRDAAYAAAYAARERDDDSHRVSADAGARVIAEAGEALGRPAFHLEVAERAPLGTFNLLELILRSEPTVGGLLEGAAHFSRLLFDHAVELTVDGRDARLSVAAPPGAGLIVEVFFVRVLAAIRETTRERYSPRSLHLQGDAPKYADVLGRIFDAPVRFRQHANQLVFEAALLERPTLTADAHLTRVLRRLGEAGLESLPPDDNFVSRVRQVIAECLPEISPSTNRVAQKLGMSARTLQRKLNEDNTSYQQLLDGVRLDLSISTLTKSQMPIAEAATLLGFADLTSFHRAFKRWMGTPPAEFRRQVRPLKSARDKSS